MIQKIDSQTELHQDKQDEIIDFLHTHLERFRDAQDDIQKCIDYARNPNLRGFIYIYKEAEQTQGISIVLKTHMEGFIPPYILVYIAVDKKTRGQGIGKKLIEFIQSDLKQGIALHVEKDNPAVTLYQRLGFTHKYLEMRYSPNGTS